MKIQHELVLKWVLTVGLVVIGLDAGSLRAGTVSCRVLQHQLDRLYFPRGEESLVLPGASFVLHCQSDTVGSGLIEWSRPGIAVSQPILMDTTWSACETLTAMIATPDIDSNSTITIRVDPELPLSYVFAGTDSVLGYPDTLLRSATGNPVYVMRRGEQSSGGPVDAVLGFATGTADRQRRDLEIAAPYIAALVPNLGRRVNSQGFLTTSAYYRFGDVHLPYLLPGSNTRRQDRFDRRDSSDVRLYPYAPDRGRGLIGNMPNRPTSLRLSYLHPGLKAAAQFFADVFARDRINVKIEAMDTTADLMLTWLPFRAADPMAGPETLYGLLSRSGSADPAHQEALSLIKQYLELARSSGTVGVRNYYLNLVDRSFKEDLGAFPLFRPIERLVPYDRLRNVRTDVDGRFLISELILLTYPSQHQPEVEQ